MVVRIAIVGPGRVGSAFARRLNGGRSRVLGFVGRTPERADEVARRLGVGRALTMAELATAHVVVFAVGDQELGAVVERAAAEGARTCGLWLHTSGRHGLEPMTRASARGMRVGSLHPVCPFADADPELAALHDAPAVLCGERRSLSLLRRLAGWLGMRAIVCGEEQDRTLYHAGCALMANGLTALFGAAVDTLTTAGGLADGDAARIADALAQKALALSAAHGAGPALSGPVRRGDDDTVRAHVAALQAGRPDALAAYRALMQAALRLAAAHGLDERRVARVQRALEDG